MWKQKLFFGVGSFWRNWGQSKVHVYLGTPVLEHEKLFILIYNQIGTVFCTKAIFMQHFFPEVQPQISAAYFSSSIAWISMSFPH